LRAIGPALAFVPINDRPLEIWIKNLIKRLTSPTQYFYKKQNPPLYFLQDLVFVSDPHKVFTHIESQKMLNQYLSQKIKSQTFIIHSNKTKNQSTFGFATKFTFGKKRKAKD
jgi:hypothetical protein